jgi:hypothetical protein
LQIASNQTANETSKKGNETAMSNKMNDSVQESELGGEIKTGIKLTKYISLLTFSPSLPPLKFGKALFTPCTRDARNCDSRIATHNEYMRKRIVS